MKSKLALIGSIALLATGCSSASSPKEERKEKLPQEMEEVEVQEELSSTVIETKKVTRTLNFNHSRVVHLDALEPTYFKPGHIEFYYCLDCDKSFYDKACQNEIPNSNYTLTNKLDGRYLSPKTRVYKLYSENVERYLKAETEQEIIAALKDVSAYNDQIAHTVSWPEQNGPFRIETSLKKDFSELTGTYECKVSRFTFERTMIPGQKVYYRIFDASNRLIHDDLSFQADDTYPLRNLYIDGVSNARDIGGWTGLNGKKVKYGMLFRGAQLNSISTAGKKTFMETLNIHHELDVRRDGSQKIFDAGYEYTKIGVWQYSVIIPDLMVGVPSFRKIEVSPGVWEPINDQGQVTHDPEEYITDFVDFGYNDTEYDYLFPAIKQIFEYLADSSHYPAYFHCSAGADRTGTMAYLISGLLGVSYEDIVKDFELTSFSKQGPRWRDNANADETAFDGYGVHYVQTGMAPENWPNIGYDIHQWGKMHEVIMNRYSADGTLVSAIENYLKTVCSVSQETIDAVRANLLEA